MNTVKYFVKFLMRTLKNLILKESAKQAKERLKIVVSHQRATNNSPEFISLLRQELITVISKYVEFEVENINVQLQNEGNNSILELNIAIPHAEAKKQSKNIVTV